MEKLSGKQRPGRAPQPGHSQATWAANSRTAQGPQPRGAVKVRLAATEKWEPLPPASSGPRRPRLPGATDGNQGENTGTYSNRTLGGTDFRVEPPEHTSCSLLRIRRCSDPNPAPVGDTDWLWFQVIGQKRDSRQVRRKRLGSNSASSPPQIPVPRGKPCRQESHIWRRCRRLKWSLGHWNCRHTVSAARRPGCCAAHRWTEAVTRFLVLWAVRDSNPPDPRSAAITAVTGGKRYLHSWLSRGGICSRSWRASHAGRAQDVTLTCRPVAAPLACATRLSGGIDSVSNRESATAPCPLCHRYGHSTRRPDPQVGTIVRRFLCGEERRPRKYHKRSRAAHFFFFLRPPPSPGNTPRGGRQRGGLVRRNPPPPPRVKFPEYERVPPPPRIGYQLQRLFVCKGLLNLASSAESVG